MKKVKILLLMVFVFTSVYSQKSETSIQYVIAIPTASLNKYIGNMSFGGMAIDYRKKINPKIAVGFDAGFNLFHKKDYDTYTEGTTSISGTQFRSSQSYPMHAAATYYLTNNKTVNFFAGLGAGTVYTNRNTDVGLYEISNYDWQFSLKPEIGFTKKITDDMGLKAALKYYANFKSSNLDGQSYIALGIGVLFWK